jgi:hypothetical protein
MARDDALERWRDRGYSDAEISALRTWARKKRTDIDRFTWPSNATTAEKRNLKRFARNIVRARLKRFYKYQPLNVPPELLAAQFRPSPFVDEMLPERSRIWRNITRRRRRDAPIEVRLSNFSFVHNPIGTMNQFAELLRVEATEVQARLNFQDGDCLDIGAYLVLQALRGHMAPVFTGGTMPTGIQKVLDAVGLREPLNMAPFRGVSDYDGVWPFHLRTRRPGKSRSARRFLEPQTIEIVADRFVKTVNEWLSAAAKRQLTPSGRRLVLKIVGEALNNAERHSVPNSDDGDWAIAGYLVRERSVELGEIFKCYIGFLSIGSSISESILAGPALMKASMAEYVSRHRRSRLSDEDLRTVFALQDGVTKNHDAAAGHRGGTGFQDIFEFFSALGDMDSARHPARMVIISGNTCINLCAPYMRGAQKAGDLSERELWFNAINSSSEPPSLDHVVTLPSKLHGTLVSMTFAVDRSYLEAQSNG